MNFKNLVFYFVITLFFNNFSSAEQTINTGIFSSVAIKGYDPVAYFLENKAVKGEKKFTYFWMNANWQFSTESNLNLFKASPDKYMPQYGGWCAYAMADGNKVRIDPNSFDLKDGKLYLNYNSKVQKKWRKKQSKYISQADIRWQKI